MRKLAPDNYQTMLVSSIDLVVHAPPLLDIISLFLL